jgi:hypothetical protein
LDNILKNIDQLIEESKNKISLGHKIKRALGNITGFRPMTSGVKINQHLQKSLLNHLSEDPLAKLTDRQQRLALRSQNLFQKGSARASTLLNTSLLIPSSYLLYNKYQQEEITETIKDSIEWLKNNKDKIEIVTSGKSPKTFAGPHAKVDTYMKFDPEAGTLKPVIKLSSKPTIEMPSTEQIKRQGKSMFANGDMISLLDKMRKKGLDQEFIKNHEMGHISDFQNRKLNKDGIKLNPPGTFGNLRDEARATYIGMRANGMSRKEAMEKVRTHLRNSNYNKVYAIKNPSKVINHLKNQAKRSVKKHPIISAGIGGTAALGLGTLAVAP